MLTVLFLFDEFCIGRPVLVVVIAKDKIAAMFETNTPICEDLFITTVTPAGPEGTDGIVERPNFLRFRYSTVRYSVDIFLFHPKIF